MSAHQLQCFSLTFYLLLRKFVARYFSYVMPATQNAKARDAEQPMGASVDRRRTVRYSLRIPVLFTCGNATAHRSAGFVRDIGFESAFVLCDLEECPRLGTDIKMTLWLPPINAEALGLRLQATGRVVRLNYEDEEPGFAVAIDFGIETNSDDE